MYDWHTILFVILVDDFIDLKVENTISICVIRLKCWKFTSQLKYDC